MSVPVGLTVPKLLPITGTFAPAFAVYFTLLSTRVVFKRIDQKKLMGLPASESDPLFVDNRCHANFAENVPFALLLGAIVEMNGGNRKALTGGFATLLILRILHVELGLKGEEARQWGRTIGHVGTLSFITGFGGYAAYLVKGYWGL